ncbi:GNAT family N-acetyltransferase [Aspergillus mulundensis]|uniref:Putative Histone acetyltransferase HPA2 n=1 Tax=Aspergillus mulundensis TaxID=1810919 RepID=A0A3D8RX30_9EURO|nr:putative Histone acetyltransferase HPA2 [Aspergillus mulundensis]RDW78558.1 putative Histone acetyltransferase HPA2 [Aspergillus mulundensis]
MPSILEDPTTKIAPSESLLLSLKSPSLNTPVKSTTKTDENVTLYPITNGPSSLPPSLLKFLHSEFSAEIERGCTYPMETPMKLEAFGEYWFGMFGVVALLDKPDGEGLSAESERDWEKECLGTFYVKPNYPGRCSHVCNAGFLTTNAARNQGVGMVMGKAYLHFAPLLGYKYSVFNLVFENNVASVKIWERLGFSVIGRVPGAARLANSEALVDALIIGKDLVEKDVTNKA